VDGTGPGIAGEVEKSGRASSRKEKAGIAEESTAPNSPGTVGAGGCGDCANLEVGTSVYRENGRSANPSSLETGLPKFCEGVFKFSGSALGATKIGGASAGNANAGAAEGSMPPPGTVGRCTDGAFKRGSGAAFLSGAATKAPGCASITPALVLEPWALLDSALPHRDFP
jgi:hypothetical protein